MNARAMSAAAVIAMVGVSRYPEPTTARKPLASKPSRENSKNRSTGVAGPVETAVINLFYDASDCYHGELEEH